MRLQSRRLFITSTLAGPSLFAGRGDRIPAPRTPFDDPLTERKMFRLTNPAVLHHLPQYQHRFIAHNNSFLLLAAEHTGTRQLYRLELKRDRLVQLTDGPGVHPYAAHLQPNDRGLFFLQGKALHQANIDGGNLKTLYTCPDEWMFPGEIAISSNNRHAALIEMKESDWQSSPRLLFESRPLCRVRVIDLSSQSSRIHNWVATEERRWLSTVLFRPGRSQLLYIREGPSNRVRNRLQLINLDGSEKASVRPTQAKERIMQERWSTDGSRLRYINYPDVRRWSANICNLVPETRQESIETPCSAFGWFRENSDSSAIVGASRRPSGPNMYVLFPKMQREITLCEHQSSFKSFPVAGTDRMDPLAAVPSPALSPDSEWLYFVTDREGLPTLYAMPLDDLIESTASN